MQQANGRTQKASCLVILSRCCFHIAQCCTEAAHVKPSGLLSTTKLNAGNVAEEEVMYTLFNLAQFLGFVEVVRREGPREDAFLQAGNPQGSDTLATLVEGLRFVMSAASGNLVVGICCYRCYDHHNSNAF